VAWRGYRDDDRDSRLQPVPEREWIPPRCHLIGGAIASSMIASMVSVQSAQHPSQLLAGHVIDQRATSFAMEPADRT